MFFACGNDEYGKLGLGRSFEDEEDDEEGVHTFQPVALPDGKQVKQVASCSEFTIVLTPDHRRAAARLWPCSLHQLLSMPCS